MEIIDNSMLWEVAKFCLTVIIIPFAVWVVVTKMKTDKEIATVREDHLRFKEEVAKSYSPKAELTAALSAVDNKITLMQTAVTQRIDTMQSNLATMIAGLLQNKGKD